MGFGRDTYKYHFKIGNKIVYRGISKDIDRREKEHKSQHGGSNGHIIRIGNRTTKKAALHWERNGGRNRRS